MPVNGAMSKGSGPSRTTFRPPWVKDADGDKAPSPSKLKSVEKSDGLKKTVAAPKENGQPKMSVKLQSREVKVPIMTETRRPSVEPLKPKEPLKKEPPKKELPKKEPPKKEPPKREPTPESDSDSGTEYETDTSGSEEESPPPVVKKVEKKEEAKPGKRNEKIPAKDAPESKSRNKFGEVKLKPVLKKTPNIDELPERPKSMLLETPVLKKVVKPDPEDVPEKPRNQLPEQPVLKKVVKKEPPIVPKSNEAEWNNFQLKDKFDDTEIAPPPPPPPVPGMPPPPPPPPGLTAPPEFEKKPLSSSQQKTLDRLRTRARRRPDWSEMMAEVEKGRKLRHVECNDRSKPILTSKSMTKVKGQFIFETEKANHHNALLQQIQGGIKLKPTKCNDRSRPILEGLRKFRRQMTIEEQILKSESRANLSEPPPQEEDDEMDDIDKLRDDLQSTKQMLALELRNKEAHERENKRLLARIQNLEAELERERWSITGEPVQKTNVQPAEELVQSLKTEAEDAQKQATMLEKKYQETAEQLDKAKTEIEEQKRKIAILEKQVSQGSRPLIQWHQYEDDDDEEDFTMQRRRSFKRQGTGPGGGGSRRDSEAPQRDSSAEPEPELSESDSEEDEATKEERRKRRLMREVKMLQTKLGRLKDKEKVSKKEREGLKDAMKKAQLALKEEKKKYRGLQKEVDKMAKLMKDVDVDEDEEKDEEDEEEEETEESDDESDSEESGSDEESESESEDEDADDEKKKSNLEPRVKRHEGLLAALKKGNYLHQANVDRLKDEVSKQREASELLQRDLDSVLSELG